MNPKTKEFREQVAEMFIKSLNEPKMPWRQDWSKAQILLPQNAATGKQYRGVNLLYLYLIAAQKGYTDMRYATFHQIQTNQWHLKAGSKGYKVEYWFPWDSKNRKDISWEDYHEQERKGTLDKNRIYLKAVYNTVFNAADIEGLPPLEKPEKPRTIVLSDMVARIANSMGITIYNDSNTPTYHILEDSIHMPPAERFETDYGYNSAVLHEESHATGAAKRLNRPSLIGKGAKNYAYDELVAEVSATFMSAHLGTNLHKLEMTEEERRNHAAYVQGWSERLKKEPEILMRAIRDAENAADYLELQAGIITEEEYTKRSGRTIEVADEKREGIALKQHLNYCSEPRQNQITLKQEELSKGLYEKISRMQKEGQKLFLSNGKVMIFIPKNSVKEHLTQTEIDELVHYARENQLSYRSQPIHIPVTSGPELE